MNTSDVCAVIATSGLAVMLLFIGVGWMIRMCRKGNYQLYVEACEYLEERSELPKPLTCHNCGHVHYE